MDKPINDPIADAADATIQQMDETTAAQHAARIAKQLQGTPEGAALADQHGAAREHLIESLRSIVRKPIDPDTILTIKTNKPGREVA